MEVKTWKTCYLKPHPLNASIYGDAADENLVDAIRKKGVLEPIAVLRNGTIVSGHRRWNAAQMLRLETVPVRFVDTEDPMEIEELVVISNEQRSKTTEQRAREFSKLKEIEAERAKRRMLATQNNDSGKAAMANLPQQESGTARDAAAKKVGFGGSRTAEKAAKVVEKIDDLRANGEAEEAEKLGKTLDKSVDRAYRDSNPKPRHRSDPPPKKEKPKKSPLPYEERISDAMQYAMMAVCQLERIQPDDPTRDEAFEYVQRWIDKTQKQRSVK